jgi:soluble calcium-activated nucleotidase 1
MAPCAARAVRWALGACALWAAAGDFERNDRGVDPGVVLFEGQPLEFAMVSDLDLRSRDPERFVWRSFLRRGRLVGVRGPEPEREPGEGGVPSDEASCSRGEARRLYRVEWGRTHVLETETAKANRSMELSELVRFEDRLLAMCDYTGLIFKVNTADPPPGEQPKVIQRWAIADGNGEQVKPCKLEWATVKDGELWVGSIGKEWIAPDGRVVHRDAEWVKTISKGKVKNVNWGSVYAALKFASNTSQYLWHEAVHWCPRNRLWYILPRKRSAAEPYDPKRDELKGTNLLLVATEDFRDIRVVEVGPLQPDRGFTALRKIPGTEDHFLALKVREVGDETATWLATFDSKGNMLMDPKLKGVDGNGFLLVDAEIKYEGLEFV